VVKVFDKKPQMRGVRARDYSQTLSGLILNNREESSAFFSFFLYKNMANIYKVKRFSNRRSMAITGACLGGALSFMGSNNVKVGMIGAGLGALAGLAFGQKLHNDEKRKQKERDNIINKESISNFIVDISDIENTKSINDLFKIYPDLRILRNWTKNQGLIRYFNSILDDYNVIKDSMAFYCDLSPSDFWNNNGGDWEEVKDNIEYKREGFECNEIIPCLEGFDDDLMYHTRLKIFFELKESWNKEKGKKQVSSDSLIIQNKTSLNNFVQNLFKDINYCIKQSKEDLPDDLYKEVEDVFNKIKKIK
jgi:hypothetical protein